MTSKQAAALIVRAGFTPPKELSTPDASKFNARRKVLDGHTFDSTLESEAYVLLKSWEQCGSIASLELQPAFELQRGFRDKAYKITRRAIKYVADFRVTDKDGTVRVIDVKGCRTPMYRLKLKLFRAKYPDVIFEEWTRSTLRGM